VYIVPSVPAPRRPSPTQSVAPFHLRESRQPHYRYLSGPSVPSGFRQTQRVGVNGTPTPTIYHTIDIPSNFELFCLVKLKTNSATPDYLESG